MNAHNIIATAGLTLALAAGTGCGFRATPEERIAKALDDIDATKAQRERVKSAADDLIGKVDASRADRAVAKGKIIEQLKSDKPDGAVVSKEAQLAVASIASVAHAFVDDGAAIHDVLSKEQREKLEAQAKPGYGMRGAFFVAGKLGYGPPADANEVKEKAGARIDAALTRIAATDAQKKELKPLALGLVDEAAPLFDERTAIKDALLAAWKSDKVDTKALHALVDKEAAKLSELADDAASRAVAAHAILTPEQRAKIVGRAL